MGNNSKRFLAAMIDCTYGILKKYVIFLHLYVLYLGCICLSVAVHSDIFNFIFGNKNYTGDVLDIGIYVLNGNHYTFVASVYTAILVLTAICKGIEIASRYYADSKALFRKATDIIEIIAVCLIIIIKSHDVAISVDIIFAIDILYYIYGCFLRLLVNKCKLDLKYFRCKHVYLTAPMGKATILSKDAEGAETEKTKKENAENKPLTVHGLIDILEKVKVKEMDVAVRYNYIIADATDVFECESDGKPFMCIDCNAYTRVTETENTSDSPEEEEMDKK